MGWRDNLERVKMPDGRLLIGASFRGVPFFVASSNRGGGRRGVVQEIPFSEQPPFFSDTGRKAGTFPVDGYVLGDDYVAQRNKLQDALEGKAGAGTLVHPHYGVFLAVCTGYTTNENAITDGGVARFSIEFLKTSIIVPPSTRINHPAKVDTAAAAALEAAQEEMGTTTAYDVAGEPNFSLTSLSDELDAISGRLRNVLPPHVALASELAALSASLTVLSSTAASLVRTPADMFAQFATIFEDIGETLLSAPRDIMLALLETIAFVGSIPDALGSTATRVLERANQAQLRDQIRRILLAKASQLAAITTYETVEDAAQDSDAISALMDAQLATATATSYQEIAMLQAETNRAVPGDQVLAEIVTITLPVALPALRVAYRQYGSVTLEPDTLARNQIRHPSILSGTLSVLADV